MSSSRVGWNYCWDPTTKGNPTSTQHHLCLLSGSLCVLWCIMCTMYTRASKLWGEKCVCVWEGGTRLMSWLGVRYLRGVMRSRSSQCLILPQCCYGMYLFKLVNSSLKNTHAWRSLNKYTDALIVNIICNIFSKISSKRPVWVIWEYRFLYKADGCLAETNFWEHARL